MKYTNIKNKITNFLFKDNVDKNLGQINFLKILFCIIVLIAHFGPYKLPNHRLYLCIDSFFIFSGYFLYNSIQKSDKITFYDFFKKRLFRIYPIYFVFLFIMGKSHTKIISNFFLLNILGLTKFFEIYWYISPLFYISLFYFYLFKNYEKKTVNLILSLIIYFSYMMLFNYTNNINIHNETIYLIFNCSTLRGLGGIAIGIFMNPLILKIKNFLNEKKYNEKIIFFIFSIIEFEIGKRALKGIFFEKYYTYDCDAFLMFIIFLIIIILNKGIFSKIINNKISNFLAKYTYSTYIMQVWSFNFFYKYIISNIPNNNLLLLITQLSFFFLIGAISYHTIEKPCYNYLNKKFCNH